MSQYGLDGDALALYNQIIEVLKPFDAISNEVANENKRQLHKWGVQNHSPEDWISIILEEFGEAAQGKNKQDWDSYRKELIETAACCIAAVENLDRQRDNPDLIRSVTSPDTPPSASPATP